MKSAVIAFLTCLLVLYVQGQSDNGRKCRCLNSFVGRMNTKLIKGLPDIYDPSVFCPQIEIIITTADQKEKCVNPESPLGKIILKNMNKGKKNEAVSPTTTTTTMTTTTSQTNTQSSTSHHSTSTM